MPPSGKSLAQGCGSESLASPSAVALDLETRAPEVETSVVVSANGLAMRTASGFGAFESGT